VAERELHRKYDVLWLLTHRLYGPYKSHLYVRLTDIKRAASGLDLGRFYRVWRLDVGSTDGWVDVTDQFRSAT
jgi:hypothetical protein